MTCRTEPGGEGGGEDSKARNPSTRSRKLSEKGLAIGIEGAL